MESKEEERSGTKTLLAGFQILKALDTACVEDLLARVGARAVPDKNTFSFASEVTRLVSVNSTANIGAKMVGKFQKKKNWIWWTRTGYWIVFEVTEEKHP